MSQVRETLRSALARVLPNATKFRRIGLVTYGPGPYNQCSVKLEFKPAASSSFSSARPDLAIMLGQTLEAVGVGLVRHPCGYLSAIRSRPEIDHSCEVIGTAQL